MKIAFIHNNAKTGASVHALMLGRRLQEKMEVTFLLEELQADGLDFSEIRDVRLFPYTPEQLARRKGEWPLHVSLIVRLRMLLFKLKCLRGMDKRSFLWAPFYFLEKKWYRKRKMMPDGLVEHLDKYNQDYDCYIVMGNYNSIPFLLKEECARKTILIPLVHYEKSQFILSAHKITRKFPFLAYNTEAEKTLCERIHGKASAGEVIGSGIEPVETNESRWAEFKQTKGIPETYLLYVGRITPGKVGELFPYFLTYTERHPDMDCKLIVIGENNSSNRIENDRIQYLGFVEDGIKADLIAHATIVVNPSVVESLSLVVLEAMSVGVPVLVNGKCEVLKQHCEKSGGGFYYWNYMMFDDALSRLLGDAELRRQMGATGRTYQQENYNWSMICSKMEAAIESVITPLAAKH